MVDKTGSANDGFVRAIKAELRGNGISQKQLGALIDMHETTISGYLTPNLAGRTVMTTEIVDAIAEALGLDYVALAVKAREWRGKPGVTAPETETASQSDSVKGEAVTPMVPDRRRKGRTRAEMDKVLKLADQTGENNPTQANHAGESNTQ